MSGTGTDTTTGGKTGDREITGNMRAIMSTVIPESMEAGKWPSSPYKIRCEPASVTLPEKGGQHTSCRSFQKAIDSA